MPLRNRIPPVLTAIWRRTDRAELDLIAAGVAFYGFLAIFPAIAVVIALWGFASDPGVIRTELELLRDFLPAEAFILLHDQVEALLTANSSQIGWATLVSIAIAFWSARAGVAALIRGLNAIHHLPNRGGVGHQLQALVLTLVLIGLMLAAMLAGVAGPLAIAFLPVDGIEALLLEAANLALGFTFIVLAIGIIYRHGPNKEEAPPLFTRGLFIALVLWALASRGLVLYLSNFGTYNRIYGSIGAVVALMIWLYLSAYAVLLGAAYDAERSTPSDQ